MREVVVAPGVDTVHVVPVGSPARVIPADALPAVVETLESAHPRWVWADTAATYPPLLRELMPGLVRAFPRAIGLVEAAARAGEAGGRVHTWLGRTSPLPPAGVLADARRARDWGRFTRNFVVQGTAAEWALAWIAAVRQSLRRLGDPG